MYTVKFTSKFKKVITLIASGTNQDTLINDYSKHTLKGNWKGFRECHIAPDWLLVYEIIENI